jgi:signal transduction histidine kinase
MRNSLKGKMILSYLAIALLTVVVVSVLIRLTSGRTLMNLVAEEQIASLKQAVQDYYTSNGSLDNFYSFFSQNNQKSPPPPQPGGGPGNSPGGQNMRGITGLVDADFRAIIPIQGYEIGQVVPQNKIQQKIAVDVNGQTIAWILPDTSLQFRLSAEEQLFLQRTNLAIGLAALAGVLAALVIGFLLAGRLLRPVRLLTRASQALARGDLRQQVPVTSTDELGFLTKTFNQMSIDLDNADQQRKRMTADITHDLSTPLQIISGYIEMLEEGEVTLTPQRIEIIKTELDHLRRLVGDMSMLTQVEAGGLEMQYESVQPELLLERVYAAFEPIAARQGVALQLNAAMSIPMIWVDAGRIVQVLNNLMENALRYTPKGGSIQLSATAGERVQLLIKDSGEGIEAEDLPYVFDRFYQADKARGANSGKVGLGLAICKALVTTQGGIITVVSGGKGQGTTMIVAFDPAPNQTSPMQQAAGPQPEKSSKEPG